MTSSPHSTEYGCVRGFLACMRIQKRRVFWGTSFFDCHWIYLFTCPSFNPTVDEKYPTLQMPSFSIYISRMNLNLVRRCRDDADFNFPTASEMATFGGISI